MRKEESGQNDGDGPRCVFFFFLSAQKMLPGRNLSACRFRGWIRLYMQAKKNREAVILYCTVPVLGSTALILFAYN